MLIAVFDVFFLFFEHLNQALIFFEFDLHMGCFFILGYQLLIHFIHRLFIFFDFSLQVGIFTPKTFDFDTFLVNVALVLAASDGASLLFSADELVKHALLLLQLSQSSIRLFQLSLFRLKLFLKNLNLIYKIAFFFLQIFSFFLSYMKLFFDLSHKIYTLLSQTSASFLKEAYFNSICSLSKASLFSSYVFFLYIYYYAILSYDYVFLSLAYLFLSRCSISLSFSFNYSDSVWTSLRLSLKFL